MNPRGLTRATIYLPHRRGEGMIDVHPSREPARYAEDLCHTVLRDWPGLGIFAIPSTPETRSAGAHNRFGVSSPSGEASPGLADHDTGALQGSWLDAHCRARCSHTARTFP